MASAGGGLRAEHPAGAGGRAPGGKSGKQSPPEADEIFVFKTLINFQCICYSFARNDVLFALLLLC